MPQPHDLFLDRLQRALNVRLVAWLCDPVVIGHSHHARLIIDQEAHLVLMDCGAWIENFHTADEPLCPNRQIGAICGADLRIYQLDAKDS